MGRTIKELQDTLYQLDKEVATTEEELIKLRKILNETYNRLFKIRKKLHSMASQSVRLKEQIAVKLLEDEKSNIGEKNDRKRI